MYQTIKEFLTYNFVGIFNTIVGFGIIFVLMFFGLDAKISNAIGYTIGAVVSYILNSRYTFKSQTSVSLALKFFGVLLVSYIINFVVLSYMLVYTDAYISQIISGIVYTLSSFVLAKYLVFGDR